MAEKILNEATIARYKLDKIPQLTYEESIEALQLLNYLWLRSDDDTKKELAVYIDEINKQVGSMKQDGQETAL
jgi:hypothetical protein